MIFYKVKKMIYKKKNIYYISFIMFFIGIVVVSGYFLNIYNISNKQRELYPWRPKGKVIDSYQIRTELGDILYGTTICYDTIVGREVFLCLEAENNGKRNEVFTWHTSLEQYESPKNCFNKLSFKSIYDSSKFRCYEFNSGKFILCKIKATGKYFYDVLDRYEDITFDTDSGYDCFKVPFAENKFSTGEFRWVKIFAKYLLYNKNIKAELVLKRYSKGDFNKKELKINQGKVTPKEIREFAKSVLQWYGRIKSDIL